jgi:hypothetical protein
MIYDAISAGIGEWHCPYPRSWVEMMKRAAKHCENVSEAQVIATLDNAHSYYEVPPGDFLSEPQDARGLPLSWCDQERARHRGLPDCCVAIYDYDSIPDVVVTNGEKDWAFENYNKILTA